MKNVFIVSKNPDLPNYLLLLLKEIDTEDAFSLSLELHNDLDVVIVDTESISVLEMEKYAIGAPILLFAYEIKPLLIQYTLRYDINGIVTLGMDASDILKTMQSAFSRDIFYPDVMISLLFSNKVNDLAKKVASLTERENEILEMMMRDFTNEEIATHLNLSVRTVNAHKGNIMRKVGTKTTSGLVSITLDYSSSFKNRS